MIIFKFNVKSIIVSSESCLMHFSPHKIDIYMKFLLLHIKNSSAQYLLLSFLMITIWGFAQAKKDTIYIFYLGGQSNMQGYGKNIDLPKSLNKKVLDVMIFQGDSQKDNHPNGGNGFWDVLQPGYGTGFSSDGKLNKLSERFGIELSFADKIKKNYPNKKIAIIKYTRNGSSIDSIGTNSFGCWDPAFKSGSGKNQYDYFLKTVLKAMSTKDINNDGIEDVLVPAAILWMQGESDGDKTEAIAQNYYTNFKQLMDLLRAAFRDNDLPILVAKISDSEQDTDGKVWNYGELVQYAQEKFVKNTKNAAIIRSTKNYIYSDKWHYDSAGYIDLGIEFAKKVKL